MEVSAKNQQGISMVELMIALLVGLILVGGVIQIYLGNKQVYRTNGALAEIQENARLAMDILGRHIRMAGYRNDTSQDFATAFSNVSFAGYTFNAGEVIRGADGEVVVRYQGNGVIRDCEDNGVITAGTTVSTRFHLDGTDLECATDVDATGSQPLLSGVSGVTVRYGIDTDGDGAANRYDRSAGVTWSQVVSVRITLTLQSRDLNIATGGGQMNKTFTTTFGLRNLLP